MIWGGMGWDRVGKDDGVGKGGMGWKWVKGVGGGGMAWDGVGGGG